jgi:hypothetical protein
VFDLSQNNETSWQNSEYPVFRCWGMFRSEQVPICIGLAVIGNAWINLSSFLEDLLYEGAAVFFDLESYGKLASNLLQDLSKLTCHLWCDPSPWASSQGRNWNMCCWCWIAIEVARRLGPSTMYICCPCLGANPSSCGVDTMVVEETWIWLMSSPGFCWCSV